MKIKSCFAFAQVALAIFAVVFLVGVEFAGLPPVKAGQLASLVLVFVMTMMIVATRFFDLQVDAMIIIFLVPSIPLQLIPLSEPFIFFPMLVSIVALYQNKNWEGVSESHAFLTVLVEFAGTAGMVFSYRIIGAWSVLFVVVGVAAIGLLWRYHNRAMKLAESTSTAK